MIKTYNLLDKFVSTLLNINLLITNKEYNNFIFYSWSFVALESILALGVVSKKDIGALKYIRILLNNKFLWIKNDLPYWYNHPISFEKEKYNFYNKLALVPMVIFPATFVKFLNLILDHCKGLILYKYLKN